MDVGTADFEVFRVANAMVGEASLPGGELRGELYTRANKK